MSVPSNAHALSDEPKVGQPLASTRIAVVEMAVTWLVRRMLDLAFQRATGHEPPTARDRGVPFRRIMAWAAVTAAAVAAADVIADRVVLRSRPRYPLA
jgi:hypothetical protein